MFPEYIPKNWHSRLEILEDEKGVHYLWTGWNNGEGHGKVSVDGKPCYTHRVIVERVDGVTLSKDEIVDHKCRHRGCINRDHLEVVTMCENTRRGIGFLWQFRTAEAYARSSETQR